MIGSIRVRLGRAQECDDVAAATLHAPRRYAERVLLREHSFPNAEPKWIPRETTTFARRGDDEPCRYRRRSVSGADHRGPA